MLHFYLTIAVCSLFCLSLHGWGEFVLRRLLRTGETASCGADIVIGLSFWVVLGGVLNCLGLARPFVLDALALVGALLATARIARGPAVDRSYFRRNALALSLLACYVGFLALYLSPPRALNIHDDLQKYILHPLRMLNAGTLAGNPFSALGSETLGGQAFLLGFIAGHAPIPYLAAFESVFCVGLCGLLLIEAADRLGWPRSGGVGALLLLLVINPQLVNISSLYSGVLLISFLAGASVLLGGGQSAARSQPSVAVTALIYAALLAFKTTYAVFVLAHISCLFFSSIRSGDRNERTAPAQIAGLTALFLLPWLLLHAKLYMAGLRMPFLARADSSAASRADVHPFSFSESFYGGAPIAYTYCAVETLLIGVVLSRRLAVNRGARAPLVAGFAGVLSFFIGIYVLGPRSYGFVPALRYVCPILLGVLPMSGLFLFQAAASGAGQSRPGLFLSRAVGACLLPIPLFFAGSAVERFRQIREFGSDLSFHDAAQNPGYLKYNRYVWSDDARQTALRLQSRVPPGEKILVWSTVPFLFDRARNPLFEVEFPLGVQSWLGAALNGGEREFETFLLSLGIRYVVFQYSDAAGERSRYEEYSRAPFALYRLSGRTFLLFSDHLRRLSAHGKRLVDDGRTAIVQIGGPAPGGGLTDVQPR